MSDLVDEKVINEGVMRNGSNGIIFFNCALLEARDTRFVTVF
jgi:hypothetical protein